MRTLYIKQKVLSLGGKFTVKDEAQTDVYFAEGSFMKIPKTFKIMDADGKRIAQIVKKTFSFMPTFFVHVHDQEMIVFRKQFTFLKARYTLDAAGIEVDGNWWDMNFEVKREGELIGTVDKKWFSWGTVTRSR